MFARELVGTRLFVNGRSVSVARMMTEGSPTMGNRWLSLLILCAGQLMIILDGSIVNVAMPAIQRELGFTQSALAWVVNAYLIAFGGLLLLAGRLGDLIGRKRMFVA